MPRARPARDLAKLSKAVGNAFERAHVELALGGDALEERLEELNERVTTLSIGAGNVAHALERTEALVARLDGLESRAVLLEAAMAKRARVPVRHALGLAGPALAWVKGDISAGRWAEVLTDWLNGQREWSPHDVGLEAWPEPPEWMTDEDHIPW